MNKTNFFTKPASSFIGVVLMCGAFNTNAQNVGPECRGVAAGVVAAMRAAGEISDAHASEVAVTAARRACAAALEGDLGVGTTTNTTDQATDQVTSSKSEAEESSSVWDLISGSKTNKPGNERLRRLKTQ